MRFKEKTPKLLEIRSWRIIRAPERFVTWRVCAVMQLNAADMGDIAVVAVFIHPLVSIKAACSGCWALIDKKEKTISFRLIMTGAL